MAKRFYDSRKYQDPWYRKLTPKYKLLWDYLLCTCSHMGIWKKDFEMASFCIGAGDYVEKECLEILKSRIVVIDKEKWFIPKYITFQYGNVEASEGRMIKTVCLYLKNNGLMKYLNTVSTECQQGVNTPKVMVKDKDKNKNNTIPPTHNQVKAYCSDRKNKIDAEEFINFYTSKGWMIGKNKMKDWKSAIITWEKRQRGNRLEGPDKWNPL